MKRGFPFQFLPCSHFPEYDVFSPCLTSIHSLRSLSGLSNKSKVDVDVDVSIHIQKLLQKSTNFQDQFISHIYTQKKHKSVSCTPCCVQVPVVHILVGPINLPQSSSLQSPDPRSSSSLQPTSSHFSTNKTFYPLLTFCDKGNYFFGSIQLIIQLPQLSFYIHIFQKA